MLYKNIFSQWIFFKKTSRIRFDLSIQDFVFIINQYIPKMVDLNLAYARTMLKLHQRFGSKWQSIRFRALMRANNFSKERVAGGNGPPVSLTTYGKRVETAYLAIESIASGWLKPSRLILWIDESQVIANLPVSLRRLKDRGLEINQTENFGPHKKYYPYVQSLKQHDRPLVTADDDVIYPLYWLWKLARSYRHMPLTVACFRAHVISCDDAGHLLPYALWRSCETRHPSYRNFATGMAGVIYPPQLLEKLRDTSEEFLICAPKADDVWLHATATRHSFQTRQVVRLRHDFPTLEGTQDMGLMHENLYNGGNDSQIVRTYAELEILRICRSANSLDKFIKT